MVVGDTQVSDTAKAFGGEEHFFFFPRYLCVCVCVFRPFTGLNIVGFGSPCDRDYPGMYYVIGT